MKPLAEWTSIPEAWLCAKLFFGLLALCLAADWVARRYARQTPTGADAWNPEGVKLKMSSDIESLSKN